MYKRVARIGVLGFCLSGIFAMSAFAQQNPKIELKVMALNPRCIGGADAGEACANDCDCDSVVCESWNICVGGSNAGVVCASGGDCFSGVCQNDPRCIGGLDAGILCSTSGSCDTGVCAGSAPFTTPSSVLTSLRPTDRFLCNVFASEWSPTGTSPEKLRSWEVSVNRNSFNSTVRGGVSVVTGDRCCRERIVVPFFPRLDIDCQDLSGCCGTLCGEIDDDEGTCTSDIPISPEAKGVYATHDRPDYVFLSNGTNDLLLLDFAEKGLTIRYAAALGNSDIPKAYDTKSTPAYLASLVLVASTDVCGQVIIPIAEENFDGLFDSNTARIETTNTGLTLDFGSCDCRSMILIDPAPNCSIDAREPDHAESWDSFTVQFDCDDTSGLRADDFEISLSPFSLFEFPPAIDMVVTDPLDPRRLTITLSESFPNSRWTCAQFQFSSVCLGVQPGDVNGDSLTEAADVDAMFDCINNPGSCDLSECDTNRSAACTPHDILRLVELLVVDTPMWLNIPLGTTTPTFCPTAP